MSLYTARQKTGKNVMFSQAKNLQIKTDLRKQLKKLICIGKKECGKFDVYPLSKKVLKKIKDRAPKERPVIEDPSVSSPIKSPEISSSQEKNDFELYEHQKAVINDWHENSNKRPYKCMQPEVEKRFQLFLLLRAWLKR